MALALSLSLDLFLMKGNLFIAVTAQQETGRQGKETTEQAQGRWRKKEKKKKKEEGRT